MRILHLNTFDHAGGAARAAYWLHSGLKKAGNDSMMLVQHKTTGEAAIVPETGRLAMLLKEIRWIIDGLPLCFYPKREVTHWSTGWFPHNLRRYINEIDPDIIHLHWICRGFASLNEIGRLCSLGRPIVWTLHDSWAFTGGCHIPGDCHRYQADCGTCPQLASDKHRDLSWRTLSRKKRRWKHNDLTVVTPSKWLTSCVKQSSLFTKNRISTIPNGIDTEKFRPVEKKTARSLLQIPDNGKFKILCGGINAHGDPNKGLHLLLQAIELLIRDGWQNRIELIIYGESEPSKTYAPQVGTQYLGVLHDNETLRLAYSAADLFVLPSIQENLPNSIIESIACETPVVAFAAGGIPDIVKPGYNGFLAEPFDVKDLGHCIQLAAAGNHIPVPVLDSCFTQVESVNQYLSLYRELSTDERQG